MSRETWIGRDMPLAFAPRREREQEDKPTRMIFGVDMASKDGSELVQMTWVGYNGQYEQQLTRRRWIPEDGSFKSWNPDCRLGVHGCDCAVVGT